MLKPTHNTDSVNSTRPAERKPLIKENEAALRLGVNVATLRRWRWAGTGPVFIKVGAAVRYDPLDLEAYIEQNRRRSTSEV